jgi:hypothetical protein
VGEIGWWVALTSKETIFRKHMRTTAYIAHYRMKIPIPAYTSSSRELPYSNIRPC